MSPRCNCFPLSKFEILKILNEFEDNCIFLVTQGSAKWTRKRKLSIARRRRGIQIRCVAHPWIILVGDAKIFHDSPHVPHSDSCVIMRIRVVRGLRQPSGRSCLFVSWRLAHIILRSLFKVSSLVQIKLCTKKHLHAEILRST